MAKKRNADVLTLGLPGIPARRGRRASGCALSNAERQKRYRARHKQVEVGERMEQTISRLAKQFDVSQPQVVRELIRFALCNRNWSQTGFPSLVTKNEGVA